MRPAGPGRCCTRPAGSVIHRARTSSAGDPRAPWDLLLLARWMHAGCRRPGDGSLSRGEARLQPAGPGAGSAVLRRMTLVMRLVLLVGLVLFALRRRMVVRLVVMCLRRLGWLGMLRWLLALRRLVVRPGMIRLPGRAGVRTGSTSLGLATRRGVVADPGVRAVACRRFVGLIGLIGRASGVSGVGSGFVVGIGVGVTGRSGRNAATTTGRTTGSGTTGLGDGSADGIGRSLGIGDSAGVGSVDGCGFEGGVGPGSDDVVGFGGTLGAGMPVGGASVPGVGPWATSEGVARPPIPTLRATAARTRFTTPSASTSRSRWAAVKAIRTPTFSNGPGPPSAFGRC